MSEVSRIAVLGAGSWGTALACHLAKNKVDTRLWGRDSKQLESMSTTRINQRYLPGLELPGALLCTPSARRCLKDVDAVLVATPSRSFRETLTLISEVRSDAVPIIWACKGLEKGTGRLLDDLASELLADQRPLAVVSGPTFARELMQGMPTAITVACQDNDFANEVIRCLHNENFRAYRSDDIIGVQIGGALKNVFAIAAGASDGLGYGANARAALITRGLAELIRLGVAMGGRRETFMGLAGVGDLVLTCTDDLSRNRRMGLALASGLSVEDAKNEIGQAVEGIGAADEARRLSQRYSIEMPITEQVYNVLYHGKSPRHAVRDLLERAPRDESS